MYFCFVLPFKEEVKSFVKSIGQEVDDKKWGLQIVNQPLGFCLHTLEIDQPFHHHSLESRHIVHIWEDQWQQKRKIVESRIASLFGENKRVFARKTKVVKLDKPSLINFLTENHLNVAVNTKHKWGLLHEDKLLAVAAFSASCPVHREGVVYKSHELVRFCSKTGMNVVGGLSKLITHFIKTQNPDDIMSYADVEWSLGKSYLQLGFKNIGILPPQTFYVDPTTMNRYYKLNAPDNLEGLLEFKNQGSIKFLLDLKGKNNA